MKKFASILLLSLGMFFTPKSAFPTPYNGGEIYWECLQNGKYVFYLKAYRDCSAINFGTTQILNSTSPAGNMNLSLVSGYPRDISPICDTNSAYTHIVCDQNSSPNSGAISEYLWKSDTISLNGIPPAGGWMFH